MRTWLQDLVGSVYSQSLYRRRLNQGTNTGFTWLLFVCAVGALPMTVNIQVRTLTDAEAPVADLIAQMPVLHFEEGHLHTDPAGAQLIMADGAVVLVIDDSIGGISSEYGKNHVLMTRDHLIARQPSGKVTAQPHDWIGTRDVTPDDLRNWWTLWQHWGWAFVWLFYFFVNYFGFGALMLVMSLVAMGLIKLSGLRTDDHAALRITALAVTPAILLNAVINATGNHIPFNNWACAALTFFCLLLAVPEALGVRPPPSPVDRS
jgi:hypothetical protein